MVAIIACAGLVVLGGATSGFASQLQADENVPEPTIGHKNTTNLTTQVVNGIVKLREQGTTYFPESYGGIASGVPGNDDVLVVYLTSLDAGLEKQIAEFSGVPDSKIYFEQAAMTRIAAEALDRQFSADAPDLQQQGFPLRSWGIGNDVSYEVELVPPSLGTSSAFESQAQSLTAKYGVGLRVSELPHETQLTGRADDRVQWLGGDFLNSTRWVSGHYEYTYCSSGFPLTNPAGNKFILTAGHCYVTGEQIYNGIPPNYSIGGWNSNLIGTLYTRTYNTGYPDAGLISADGSRGMWTGSSDHPTTSVTVTILNNPWPNMPLCVDGAYEGEVCGLHITNSDHTVCIGSAPCFAHQSTADGGNPQAIAFGDSGGPLYATIEGNTWGVGIASSNYGSVAAVCNNWTDLQRICMTGVNIQNIGPILTQWGLSLDP